MNMLAAKSFVFINFVFYFRFVTFFCYLKVNKLVFLYVFKIKFCTINRHFW